MGRKYMEARRWNSKTKQNTYRNTATGHHQGCQPREKSETDAMKTGVYQFRVTPAAPNYRSPKRAGSRLFPSQILRERVVLYCHQSRLPYRKPSAPQPLSCGIDPIGMRLLVVTPSTPPPQSRLPDAIYPRSSRQ